MMTNNDGDNEVVIDEMTMMMNWWDNNDKNNKDNDNNDNDDNDDNDNDGNDDNDNECNMTEWLWFW